MGYDKKKIKEMLKAAEDHDSLIKAKGYKADRSTDAAYAKYEKLRKNATPQERALFDRLYN